MPKLQDLTGQTFNRLTVLRRAKNMNRATRWVCRCSCGKELEVHAVSLRNGDSSSCGCLLREIAQKKAKKLFTRHGMSSTPEYKTWKQIHARCSNKKLVDYKNYGERGISVSAAWTKFSTFFRDMGPRPSAQHSIERRDTNGNYCKENCYWATRKTQNNNRRNNVFVEFLGEKLSMACWAQRLGISTSTLEYRLKNWPIERALSEPPRRW